MRIRVIVNIVSRENWVNTGVWTFITTDERFLILHGKDKRRCPIGHEVYNLFKELFIEREAKFVGEVDSPKINGLGMIPIHDYLATAVDYEHLVFCTLSL